MSFFENFDLDIILLIEAFCPTCLTHIQLLCVCNPIISVYLFNMFNIKQTSNTQLSHMPLTLVPFHAGMAIKCKHVVSVRVVFAINTELCILSDLFDIHPVSIC